MKELFDYMPQQLEDHDILFFPEKHQKQDKEDEERTGRSLTGKIGEFTSLYLGAVRRAVENGTEVQLVPTDITYQELPEAKFLGKKESDSFWEKIEEKADIFYSEKLPAHLNLGEPIDYEIEKRKEIREEIEEKVHNLVKPTPSSLVAQAVEYLGENFPDSKIEDEVERIYDSLQINGVDTSLLYNGKIDEIIEEGKDLLSWEPFTRNFDRDLVEIYKNQIQHIL